MSDLIRRDDAIDVVHYYIESGYKCDIFQELKNLPSAGPERKKGTWIKDKRSLWSLAKCSLCGYISVEDRNFCPNCGADMRLQNA